MRLIILLIILYINYFNIFILFLVTWFKDGQRIFIDKKKYEMTENGDLIVLNVDKYAAGNYTCRATNMAGSRDTPPAIVWVYGKFQSFDCIWYSHGTV